MNFNNWNLIIIPYLSGFTTQVIKFLNFYLTQRELNFRRLIEMGGMPSTHSSVSVTLTTLLGIYKGISSPFFVISLFLSFFIMIEAAGIRRITGRHAEVIKKILNSIDSEELKKVKLQNPIGHTPLEVIIGSIYGFVFAFAFSGG